VSALDVEDDAESPVLGQQVGELLGLGVGEPFPAEQPIAVHEIVASLATSAPDLVAVEGAGESVTYAELRGWAACVATQLAALGVGRGSNVAVLVPPSAAMVAAVLGVLDVGAAYVPIDDAQPDGRISAILRDAGAVAGVVSGRAADRIRESGLPVVDADDARSDDRRPVAPTPSVADDAAYVLYTSGSTGEPKGVVVEHGQLAASTRSRRLVYPRAHTFLLVSPLAFDSSAAGLWGTLTSGGRLVVASADDVRDPARLVELIERHQVTRLLCVPGLYSVVLDAAERVGSHRLGSLDAVIVAGEPLWDDLIERHFQIHGRHTALVNEYGPTETTVWATYQRFDEPGPVSIGRPIPSATVYVLDDNSQPVPRGTDGELYIGGAGVARGYLGRPEATARAFVDDPFTEVTGARLYRTGDIVRWNDDGTINFVGRRDHQVKIRGHRVEIGAVEAALRRAPGVRDAAVVTDATGTRLAAFVVAVAGTSAEDVRAFTARLLPDAMVPATVRILEELPSTLSGKVDRLHLTNLAGEPQLSRMPTASVDPPTGTLALVAAAWSDVLGRPNVPRDVNFFDLGGHSLAMFELQQALERRTGTRPSVIDLFRHTTVAAQANLITDGRPDDRSADRYAEMRRRRALRARRRRGGETMP
jgi:amino acid adenylation domain-containing protein